MTGIDSVPGAPLRTATQTNTPRRMHIDTLFATTSLFPRSLGLFFPPISFHPLDHIRFNARGPEILARQAPFNLAERRNGKIWK